MVKDEMKRRILEILCTPPEIAVVEKLYDLFKAEYDLLDKFNLEWSSSHKKKPCGKCEMVLGPHGDVKFCPCCGREL